MDALDDFFNTILVKCLQCCGWRNAPPPPPNAPPKTNTCANSLCHNCATSLTSLTIPQYIWQYQLFAIASLILIARKQTNRSEYIERCYRWSLSIRLLQRMAQRGVRWLLSSIIQILIYCHMNTAGLYHKIVSFPTNKSHLLLLVCTASRKRFFQCGAGITVSTASWYCFASAA
jgi:hypothetical protein